MRVVIALQFVNEFCIFFYMTFTVATQCLVRVFEWSIANGSDVDVREYFKHKFFLGLVLGCNLWFIRGVLEFIQDKLNLNTSTLA